MQTFLVVVRQRGVIVGTTIADVANPERAAIIAVHEVMDRSDVQVAPITSDGSESETTRYQALTSEAFPFHVTVHHWAPAPAVRWVSHKPAGQCEGCEREPATGQVWWHGEPSLHLGSRCQPVRTKDCATG